MLLKLRKALTDLYTRDTFYRDGPMFDGRFIALLLIFGIVCWGVSVLIMAGMCAFEELSARLSEQPEPPVIYVAEASHQAFAENAHPQPYTLEEVGGAK